MNKEAALTKLRAQLEQAGEVERGPSFKQWHRNTELAIEKIFGADTRHLKDFNAVNSRPGAHNMARAQEAHARAFASGIEQVKAVLSSMIDEVTEYWSESGAVSPAVVSLQAFDRVEVLCRRFHAVARQLRQRHAGRVTLDITDEYDVQDLMHALLRLDFVDVRAEEWCPSYAGKNARMDFLLKQERIVLELKKTRRSLSASDIGDQLIVDVARYAGHPDCSKMVCFVYDPDALLGNPAELERDLSGKYEDLQVVVIVAPQA
jgi:hypothetical protein